MERNILFIGVLERDKDRDVLKVIKQILILSQYQVIYESIDGAIIGLCKSNLILIVFDFLEEDFNQNEMVKMDFDILVHNFSEEIESNLVKKILANSGACVLNSDNNNLISLVRGLNSTLITYGFNGKATLTISSYDVDPIIKINICLQRDIISLNGRKTEPFEFCISMDSTEEKKIYPLLAGTALNILLGDTILNQKQEDHILLSF
ncbi:hypothetical protein E9840_08050 [Tissierella creatinini]|nr:hypothetical protein E9840_08050 [Tissierella creatinini]TJX66684.1 hypothetical protein E8P77_07425 [Soehngenia saccharolytica]